MKNWKDGTNRYALNLKDMKEACVIYQEGTTFFVQAYLDGGCQEAKLTATSLDTAKIEAESWFTNLLNKRNESHLATIAYHKMLVAQMCGQAENSNPVSDMDTLKQRDEKLREAFMQFADVPMNPETEVMEAPFLHFPAGTSREDIWKWFDERYSKGIVDLLYHEGIDHYPELQKLFHRRACCFECDSETCALNPEGTCLYPILYGEVPEFVDEEGCTGFLYKESRPVTHQSHDAVMMEDFNRRKPVGNPTGRAYWFTAEFTKGSQCVNDLLRAFLKDHGIWYTNTVSGEVWFQYQGEWRKCEQEVDGNTVRFFIQEFDMG